jgi:hypothetical protein
VNSIETACQNIYTETKIFYTQLREELKGNDFGFKILNGPPHYKAPVFLISYQPGGSEHAQKKCKPSECTWPERLEHVYEHEWKLSKRLQNLFEPLPVPLESCVALNAIFFRAPEISAWNKALPAETRKRVRKFCIPHVEQILRLVNPKLIIVNGFATLKLFGVRQKWEDVLSSETRGLILIKKGQLANCPTLAINHLSGFRYRTNERENLYNQLRELINEHNMQ